MSHLLPYLKFVKMLELSRSYSTTACHFKLYAESMSHMGGSRINALSGIVTTGGELGRGLREVMYDGQDGQSTHICYLEIAFEA